MKIVTDQEYRNLEKELGAEVRYDIKSYGNFYVQGISKGCMEYYIESIQWSNSLDSGASIVTCPSLILQGLSNLNLKPEDSQGA